jgi:hypothetical protein
MTKEPLLDCLINEFNNQNHSNDSINNTNNKNNNNDSISSSLFLINDLINYDIKKENSNNETTKLNNDESNKNDDVCNAASGSSTCCNSSNRSSLDYSAVGAVEFEHKKNNNNQISFDTDKESYVRNIIKDSLNYIIDQIELNISTSKSIVSLKNNSILSRHDYSNEDNNKILVDTVTSTSAFKKKQQNISSTIIIPHLNNLISSSSRLFDLLRINEDKPIKNKINNNEIILTKNSILNDPFYDLKQNWLNKYKVNRV